MPSNFEMAVIAFLIANLLATVYYNYQSEEDYADRNKPRGRDPRTK